MHLNRVLVILYNYSINFAHFDRTVNYSPIKILTCCKLFNIKIYIVYLIYSEIKVD